MLWPIGLGAALMTAFYIFRLYSLTVEGNARWGEGKHPHEASRTMTVPLVILAFLSVVGGFVGLPPSLGGSNPLEGWLDPVFARAQEILALPSAHENSLEYVLMALSVLVAVGGALLARSWYLRNTEVPGRLAAKVQGLYTLLLNKYYVDEAYDAAIVTPMVRGSEKLLWRIVDVGVIDWCVNALAKIVAAVSRTVRVVQTGFAQSYVLVFVFGVVVIIGWLLAR